MNTSIERWRAADGDNTLALAWPLDAESTVWEIGGFEGRWAQQIWDEFHCDITIFEPQLWAVERMQKRFRGLEGIHIRPYGLMVPPRGYEWESLPLGNVGTDGASIYSDKEPIYNFLFRDYRKEIRRVELALMNIEGYEYDLLPAMIETEYIKYFNYFWCQFHPRDEDDLRHEAIYEGMKMTHRVLWDFFPTAVAWTRG